MVNSNKSDIEYIQKVRAIIKEKCEGKIIPKHDDFGHHYQFPSGKIVDSVTTKLIVDKPHLVKWAAKMSAEWLLDGDRHLRITAENKEEYIRGAILAHTDKRDDAADVGTLGHNIVEEYMLQWIKDEVPAEDIRSLVPKDSHYRVTAIARSAEAIFKKNKCIPIATEILVGSEKWNCAGSLDAIVMINGKLEMFDWKTSNQVSDTYAIQIAAYKKFFEEMTGLKIHRCRIMKLDKYSDKFKIYDVPNIREAFSAFVAISKVYDWVNNNKLKLVESKKIIKI